MKNFFIRLFNQLGWNGIYIIDRFWGLIVLVFILFILFITMLFFVLLSSSSKNILIKKLRQVIKEANKYLDSKSNESFLNFENKKKAILEVDTTFLLNIKPHIEINYIPAATATDTKETYSTKIEIFNIIKNRFYDQEKFFTFNDFIESIATECLLKKLTYTKYIERQTSTFTDDYDITTSPSAVVGYAFGGGGGSTTMMSFLDKRTTYVPSITQYHMYLEKVDETFDDLKNHIKDYYNELLYSLILTIDYDIDCEKKYIDKNQYYKALINLNNYTNLYFWKEQVLKLAFSKIYNLDYNKCDYVTKYIQQVKDKIFYYKYCKTKTKQEIREAIENVENQLRLAKQHLNTLITGEN